MILIFVFVIIFIKTLQPRRESEGRHFISPSIVIAGRQKSMVGKNIVAYGHLPSLAILDPKFNTFAKHVRLSSVSAGADTGFQPRGGGEIF